MVKARLHRVKDDRVATVVVLGWLLGTAIASVALSLSMIVNLTFFQARPVLSADNMVTFAFLTMGLGSSALVLPNALAIVWLLTRLAARRAIAIITIILVASAYGVAFRTIAEDMPFLTLFWWAAPVYGVGLAAVYAWIYDE